MGCKGSRVRIPPSRPIKSTGQLSQGADPFGFFRFTFRCTFRKCVRYLALGSPLRAGAKAGKNCGSTARTSLLTLIHARFSPRLTLEIEDAKAHDPKARLRAVAGGTRPREVIAKFKTMQMVDVHLPTTDGRELTLSRYTQPAAEHRMLQVLVRSAKHFACPDGCVALRVRRSSTMAHTRCSGTDVPNVMWRPKSADKRRLGARGRSVWTARSVNLGVRCHRALNRQRRPRPVFRRFQR